MSQGRSIRSTKEQITPIAARAGRIVEPGTVLMSFKLSIGKVGIAEVPLYTNEAIAALPIRRPDLVIPGFLARSLESQDLASGSNRAAMGATLNKAKLQSIQIPLPPLEEQRRIAEIMDHVDALRAKRAAALAELNALASALLAEELGKARGRAAIPFGDLCQRVTVGVVIKPASYYVEAGVPALRTLNVRPGRIDLRDLVYFSPEANDGPLAKSRLRTGDLLIARTGRPGTAAVVPPNLTAQMRLI